MQDRIEDLPKSSDEEDEQDPPTTSSQLSHDTETIDLVGENDDDDDENDIEMVDTPSEDATTELSM